ncbi:hypothetical protein ACLFMI_08400 [Pseudonocardia nantongensis]|uniref:hypothetical protein n=1 Tax=Pseudonocardia nantongensis TaxID=1181885 RepID=UPI0039788559
MGVLGEMFPRKRIHEDSDAAQGGQRWALGPIDLENGVVTLQAAGEEAGDADQGEPDDAGNPEGAGGTRD